MTHPYCPLPWSTAAARRQAASLIYFPRSILPGASLEWKTLKPTLSVNIHENKAFLEIVFLPPAKRFCARQEGSHLCTLIGPTPSSPPDVPGELCFQDSTAGELPAHTWHCRSYSRTISAKHSFWFGSSGLWGSTWPSCTSTEKHFSSRRLSPLQMAS